jgi:hypothetical protein
MDNTDFEQLRYPIGKFAVPDNFSSAYIAQSIETIASFPGRLRKEVAQLSEAQLQTPYRAQGWNVRQVVHHCADSHMNCFIRIKWALTEERPTIKFYYEDRWSEMEDNRTMPIEPTLNLLDGLHYRLAFLMKGMSVEDLERSYIHPEYGKEFRLKEVIGLYAWHCEHHLAHITELKKRQNWT